VSRVLSTNIDWYRELELVFAMHVHVSPNNPDGSKYTITQLRGILKGLSYFDNAITSIMPAERKENEWAVSNVQGRSAKPKLKNAYALVHTKSWKPLFTIFDKVAKQGILTHSVGIGICLGTSTILTPTVGQSSSGAPWR
jgi:hypothetical protein